VRGRNLARAGDDQPFGDCQLTSRPVGRAIGRSAQLWVTIPEEILAAT
jgi:hypothetical protein